MPLGLLSVNAVIAALSGNQEVAVVSKDRGFSHHLTSGVPLKVLMWETEVGVISFKFRCSKTRYLNPC